jgi:hypothetical protein
MSTLPEQRLALAQKLAGLEGRAKIEAILDVPDPGPLVRRLPAEDLYFTIKEVGLEDASELVELCSPAQFRAFIDLDCWHRDGARPRGILPWLAAAGGGEGFKKKLRGLDLELLELLLHQTTDMWLLEDDLDREPTGSGWRSPEGKYVLDFKAEGEELHTLHRLLDTYYAENPLEAVRFLEAVRWELPSELEEIARRFRTGRLADLGFPELEDALKLYAYVDPDAPLPTELAHPSEPPGFFLETLGSQGFLDETLTRLGADGLSRIDRELVAVFNGALVADGVEPGELDGVRRHLAAARDHLSLALEYVAQGDVARAAEMMLQAPIARIFQVGSGLTLKRKFRADRLMKAGFASLPSARNCFFDVPLGAAIDGLRRRRPQLAIALERANGGRELRPFRARADLGLIDAALDRAEALAALVQRSGLDLKQAEAAAKAARGELWSNTRLSDLWIHLALQGHGQTVASLQPLQGVELPGAIGWALAAPGRASAGLIDALQTRLTTLAQTDLEREMATALGEHALARALSELSPVFGANEIELALVGGLPVLVAA